MNGPADNALRNLSDIFLELYAPGDLVQFRARLAPLILRLFPDQMFGYTEICQRTGVASSIVTPEISQAMLQIFDTNAASHPCLGHILSTGDEAAVTVSDFVSLRQFRQLGIFHDFYRVLDVDRQLGFGALVQPGLMVAIACSRPGRDYSAAERVLLDLLRPHIVQAWRNAKRLSDAEFDRQMVLPANNGHGAGTITFDADGKLRICGPAEERRLAAWFPGMRPGRLPEELLAWVKREVASLRSLRDPAATVQPLVWERNGGRLEVRLMFDQLQMQYALILDERPLPSPPVVASFDRHLLGLTRREAEVLTWMAQGKTNEEIAIILGVSFFTIKAHVRNILDRLGVENRTAAATLALAAARPEK